MSNKLSLVIGDDWEGLYCDDALILEEHSIQRQQLIEYMKAAHTMDVEFIYLNEDGVKALEDRGSLYDNFNEIPKDYFER